MPGSYSGPNLQVHGNMYGTSLEAVNSVRSAGKICILDLDMPGVMKVRKTSLCPKSLFVSPPSMPVLEKRLRGRGTEDESKILLRLENAHKELEFGTAPGNFDRIIINGELDVAFSELVETLQKRRVGCQRGRHRRGDLLFSGQY